METDIFNLENYEIFDLTHTMYHRMPSWPGHSEFTVQDLKILNIDGYAVKKISMNTHHGTHIDVAAHMIEDGKTLEKYPITSFIGSGVAIDFSNKKPGEPIESEDFDEYKDVINNNDMVFIHTGWDKKRGNNKEYLYLWPYLDISGAEFLTSKKIKLVGTDGLSIGGWSSETPMHKQITDTAKKVHEIILNSGAIIAEEVANIDKLLLNEKYVNALFFVMPLNIMDSDGSPVRILAFKQVKK